MTKHAATAPRPKALKIVTLQEFFDLQGRGAQARMSADTGVDKSTLSSLAAATRADDPRPGFKCRLKIARAIRAHMESHGYTVDIEKLQAGGE